MVLYKVECAMYNTNLAAYLADKALNFPIMIFIPKWSLTLLITNYELKIGIILN